MLNLIETEFLKLKGSKIVLITLIGAFIPPFLSFFEFISYKMNNPALTISFSSLFNQTLLFTLGLFSIILFSLIISYLFLREFNDHTLKSVLSIPISRNEFLLGKFLMFLIWTLILGVFTFCGDLIFGFIVGATGFSLEIAILHLVKLVLGSFLLFLSMSPLILIVLWLKEIFAIVIISFCICIGNIFLYNWTLAPIFPWLSPSLLVSGEYINYSTGILIPLLSLVITFLIGLVLSRLYFNKTDLPL